MSRRELLAKGSIRVDARRAVAKLRQHLLVDLHDYVLELMRAAITCGATQVDVRSDADELAISWHGKLPPITKLARLLDYVLGDIHTAEARRLRLLALGVNAALGLATRSVDVLRTSKSGRCSRVRFTPDMLANDEADTPDVRIESVAVPSDLPPDHIRVLVTRKLSWQVLRRSLRLSSSREELALARACIDLPAKMTLNGKAWRSPRSPHVLLAVPLTLSSGLGCKVLRAELQLTDRDDEAPALHFLEHGVMLASYALPLAESGLLDRAGDRHAPVRVVVDAHPLPTNASRSALREDAALLGDVLHAIGPALMTAIEQLVELAPERRHDATLTQDPLQHALSRWLNLAVAAHASGVPGTPLSHLLLDCPMVQDGCGRWRSYIQWLDVGALYALRSEEPLDEQLGPWARHIVWLRGLPAEQSLLPLLRGDADLIVQQAKQATRRRAQLLAHAPTSPTLPDDAMQVCKEAFRVEEGPYQGLHGEVALRRGGSATLRVFVDERPLCVLPLLAHVTPLAVDIALAWPEHIVANFAYDGVEQNRALIGATLYALYIATKQAEAIAAQGPPDDPELCALLQNAIVTCLAAPRALQLAQDTPLAFGIASPLAQCPLWRTSDPRRRVALGALCQYARRGSAICYVSPSRTGVAPDGRPVLAATEAIAASLGEIIGKLNGDTIELVPYDNGLSPLPADGAQPSSAQRRATLKQLWLGRKEEASSGVPAMMIERPGVLAIVGPADTARKTVAHAGHALVSLPLPRTFGATELVVDDITAIPSRRWNSIRWRQHTSLHDDFELELLHTITMALAGDALAAEQLFDSHSGQPWLTPDELPASVSHYLLDSAALLRRRLERAADSSEQNDDLGDGDLALQGQLLDSLTAVPLVRMLDEMAAPQPASLRDIAAAHPAPSPIPWLKEAPDFRTLKWHPLLLGERATAALLERWSEQSLKLDTANLPRRRREAARAQAHDVLLMQPEIDIDTPPAGADSALPHVVEHTNSGLAQLLLAVADTVFDDIEVQVTHQRRRLPSYLLPRFNLPVVARFESVSPEHFLDWAKLDADGVSTLRTLFLRALLSLAKRLVEAADDDHPLTAPPIALILSTALQRRGPEMEGHAEELRTALRRASCWPTVQGGNRALVALRRKRKTIYHGRERHTPWLRTKRNSELDSPVLWSPEAGWAATRNVLLSLGMPLRDVTGAVAQLQQRRSQGTSGQAPKLPHGAAHPELRASLARLLGSLGDGELEVIDGRVSHITVLDLNGVHSIEHREPPAMQAIIRIDGLFDKSTPERLLAPLRSAARRHLLSLAERLDELPGYARDQLRAAILLRVEQQRELRDAERAAPILPDINGAFHSIEHLTQQLQDGPPKIWVTTAGGPYPTRDYGRTILHLSEEALTPLRRLLPLHNTTRALKRDLEAERRAQAAQRSTFTIPEDVRAMCLEVATIHNGDLSGEVAVLDSNAASLRNIHLAADGRPLCALDDGSGWPIYAVVNSRTARPNRFFDGMRDHAHAKRIVQQVRQVALGMLQQMLAAPPDALASRWVHHELPDGTVVEGQLWLPARWMAHHSVGLRGAAVTHGSARTPLVLARESWLLAHQLPVAGELLLDRTDDEVASLKEVASALWEDVVALAKSAHEQRDEPGGMPNEVDRYLWDLALLGADLPARAPTTDGWHIDARAVLDELAERGTIWWSEQRGSADGQLPADAPGFVLHQQSGEAVAPAIRVLGARARKPLLRELGGMPQPQATQQTAPDLNEQLMAWHNRTSEPQPQQTAGDLNEQLSEWHMATAEDLPPGAETAAATIEPAPPGWLGKLVRNVVDVFVDPNVPAPDDVPLVAHLRLRLGSAKLFDHPEQMLGLTKRGRPVSYRKGRLRLHLEHELVAPHTRAQDGAAASYLAAAALSELNRAHQHITSAEELHSLVLLMNDLTTTSPEA